TSGSTIPGEGSESAHMEGSNDRNYRRQRRPTIRGEVGATVLGPDNVPIGAQNPGAPDTDAGSLPNLKFPFAAAHNRLLTGGWAREVTVRELPVATTLAGV